MKLVELVNTLDLTVLAAKTHLSHEVTGGYASDLLSDVMANARAGSVWVTLQVHVNIVAVASLTEMAGIILINGRQPDEDTVQKADSEHIPILVSRLPAFELIGRLHDLGIQDRPIENDNKTQ